MSAESQRVCGNCEHPKRGHEFPQSEGGHGGGTSGRCITFGCHCREFEPTNDFVEQEYAGKSDLPSWVKEGAKVRVKKTPYLREFGIGYGNNRAWPGEVGIIERQDGIGWWDWRVRFKGGHVTGVDHDLLENVVKVR